MNGTRSKNLLCSDCHDITHQLPGLRPRQRRRRHGLGHARHTGRRRADLHPRLRRLLQRHLLPRQLRRQRRPRARRPTWTTAGDARLHLLPRRAAGADARSRTTRPTPTCATCHGAGYSATTVVAGDPRGRHGEREPHGLHALPRRPDPDGASRDLERRGGPWLQRHRRRHHRRHGGDVGRGRRPRGAPHRHALARHGARLQRVPHGSRGRRRRPRDGHRHAAARAPRSRSARSRRPAASPRRPTRAARPPPAANGAGTCSNVYCHGNFKNGATTARAVLARRRRRRGLRQPATACPPAGRTRPSSACGSCHTGYTVDDRQPGDPPERRASTSINLTCTSCHGDGGTRERGRRRPEPGVGASARHARRDDGRRGSARTSRHVNPAAAGAVYKPVACTECHANNAGNIGHSNNVGERDVRDGDGREPGRASRPPSCRATGRRRRPPAPPTATAPRSTRRRRAAAWRPGPGTARPPTAAAATSRLRRTANHHNAGVALDHLLEAATPARSTRPDAILVAGGLHVNGAINTADAHLHHLPRQRDARRHRQPGHRTSPPRPPAPALPTPTATPRPPSTASACTPRTSSAPGRVRCSATPATPSRRPTSTRPASPPPAPSSLANLSTTGGITTATYAGTGGTCSNTYCHGNLGGGIGATNVTPTWTRHAGHAGLQLLPRRASGGDLDRPLPPEPHRLRQPATPATPAPPSTPPTHVNGVVDVHHPDLHHLPR